VLATDYERRCADAEETVVRTCVRVHSLPCEEARQADATRDGIQTRSEHETGNDWCKRRVESTRCTHGGRTYLGVCRGVAGVCGEWLRVLWWHLEV
jgi:hypothetical protein